MRKLALAGLGIVLSAGVAAVGLAAEGGNSQTVTGSLRDSFCYAAMGAQGSGHKKCAIGCASKGIPILLVEKGTNKSYVVLPPKDAQPVPKEVIDKMEQEVTVTGKTYQKDGTNFIQVESVK